MDKSEKNKSVKLQYEFKSEMLFLNLVLTSVCVQDMRANPINLLLTSIAVADMLIMAEYIPFSVHMYIMEDRYETFEQKVRILYIYPWIIFIRTI